MCLSSSSTCVFSTSLVHVPSHFYLYPTIAKWVHNFLWTFFFSIHRHVPTFRLLQVSNKTINKSTPGRSFSTFISNMKPNLAKSFYGWTPLQLHHTTQNWKKKKNPAHSSSWVFFINSTYSPPHSHGWKSVGYFNDIHYWKIASGQLYSPLGYIIW